MIILRIFIEDESLIHNKWTIINGTDELGNGTGSISEILSMEYEYVEVYLSPHLSTIFKVNLDNISDRKINDELLLGLVEDNLVEDIENCKPILMRLSDGQSYIAVLDLVFYNKLIEDFQDHVKQIKFIQPMPFITNFIEDKWTIYLCKDYRFVRTSAYEYYLLDDNDPIPDVLDLMLQDYHSDEVILYTDNNELKEYIEQKYKLTAVVGNDLNFGLLQWNYYNAKSKKINIKLDEKNKQLLFRLLKTFAVFVSIAVVIWIINFIYLIVSKYQLEKQITNDLTGVVRVDKYQSNLLSKVNDQLNAVYHTKGLYAPSDFTGLFDTFLRNTPDVNQNNIIAIKYSSSTLNIFLNSQFNGANFDNVKEILLTKRILANITDYKTYSAQNSSSSSQNNNGGGLLDDSSNSTNSQQLSDAAWVISLQTVTRLDVLNEKTNKTKN